MTRPATTPEACDACAGREPVVVTCSRHFIEALDEVDE